jgi:hypothetical protein
MNSFLAGVCVGSFIAYMFMGIVMGNWLFVILTVSAYAMVICAASVDYIVRRYYEERGCE